VLIEVIVHTSDRCSGHMDYRSDAILPNRPAEVSWIEWAAWDLDNRVRGVYLPLSGQGK